MSAHQRLWCAALCQTLLDAMDDMPSACEVEAESRRISRGQIENIDASFAFMCDAIDANPEYVRDKFLSGQIKREDVVSLFSAVRRQ